ncbi:MAG: 30S ribosomal protein S12 methylthiotransferase RimO [Acidobacteriota bacterium]
MTVSRAELPTASDQQDEEPSGAPQKVGLISLGCPKNTVDSEVMLGQLERQGFEITSDLDQASTVIVNTCGFIDEAKEESVETILEVAEAKGEGRVRKLFVAGCMVNRYAEELAAEIPEIDGFVGLDDLTKVGDLVSLGSSAAPAPSRAHVVFDDGAERRLVTRSFAYLKVAEGCNNPCTFCAIPVWRGRFRSRSVASLVREAQHLEAGGTRELVLLAQDTTRYGEDLGERRTGLQKLIEALLANTSIPWIRFMYAYPTTLDEGLLELMGQEERLVSYLDMPLQHSHPDILRGMRRGGSATTYLRQLEKARRHAPDVSLRSTFITGFPGETEAHFQHLMDFVREVRFDHLGAFVFSPEPDIPATQLEERPSRPVAIERRARLLEAQEGISLASRRSLVGKTLDVLVEGVCSESEHLLEGRHAGQAPEVDGRVLINDGAAPSGTFAQIEISEAFADDVVGHVVGPLDQPGVVPAAVMGQT